MYRIRIIPVVILTLLFASTSALLARDNLPDFTGLVKQVAPAVVNVSASKEVKQRSSRRSILDEFFGRSTPRGNQQYGPQPSAEGSGFIISSDGYILTNRHVVDDADLVEVRISDGREYTAEVIGTDAGTDVALLKIQADEKLPVLRTGDSENLEVGEWVLGFGAPFGFDQTVTAGIVSAKRRTLGREQYVPFIQTDVAINPGNSGGPLVSMKGQVVGINSQILSRSGGYIGLSFAIPIETALHVAEQFKKYGEVKRGYLGVQYQDVTYDLAKAFDLENVSGALLNHVQRDSAADKAGLKNGDIILSFDGKKIRRSGELPFVVGLIEPGTEVEVEIVREGKRKEIDLVVGERPTAEAVATTETELDSSLLGILVEDIDADTKRDIEADGILVTQITQGPAARAGIRRGDIILAVANRTVSSVNEFQELVESLPRNQGIPVLILRSPGIQRFLTLYIPEE
ncbi:MAG: DegQ family serine endoprotease [Gammaproteobacteria bacterium]|nr:DegQ family serine endoprotease [Gammaproteobacteria bacterium]